MLSHPSNLVVGGLREAVVFKRKSTFAGDEPTPVANFGEELFSEAAAMLALRLF